MLLLGSPLEHNFSQYISAILVLNNPPQFLYLLMLLQLDNIDKYSVNKLLSFARENHIELTVLDNVKDNLSLPGKPLSPKQLNTLIEKSRISGMISMKTAHKVIHKNFNGD